MAVGDPQLGTGVTIALAAPSAAFFAKVLSIDWSGISRATVGTSHMATAASAHTFMPGDLYDPGSISVEMIFNSTTNALTPLVAVAGTVVVTFDDAKTWSSSGFMTGFGITARNEELITASATIKLTGAISLA